MKLSLKLWTINRWLRWTGFRLFIQFGKDEPSRIGLGWYGLVGSERWRRIEGTADQ